MSKTDKKKQISAGSRRGKGRGGGARSKKSSSKKKTSKKPTSRKVATKKARSGRSASSSEIPTFDLAEQIMAEQRKITAVKRKAPRKKIEVQETESKAEGVGHSIGRARAARSEEDRIIAEIVARDIEKLCGGDTVSGGGKDLKNTNKERK